MKIWFKIQLQPIDIYIDEEDLGHINEVGTRRKIMEAVVDHFKRALESHHDYQLGGMPDLRFVGRTNGEE